jgi:hypothetical protein
MELKDRISEAMKSAKLTPAGLARAADVTKSAVFKDGNKWRLSDGSNTFFATISDDLLPWSNLEASDLARVTYW